MSIHKTSSGRWQVKWPEGNRRRAMTVDTQPEAKLLDLQIKDAKRTNDCAQSALENSL